MVSALCYTPLPSIKPFSSNRPGILLVNSTTRKVVWIRDRTPNCKGSKFQSIEAKASDSNQSTKITSIVCSDCDGNGAVLCSQCKGTGVNSVDHFNGRFKAGELCWLCRGKKDILCGACNGAGFIGGFMSTCDD